MATIIIGAGLTRLTSRLRPSSRPCCPLYGACRRRWCETQARSTPPLKQSQPENLRDTASQNCFASVSWLHGVAGPFFGALAWIALSGPALAVTDTTDVVGPSADMLLSAGPDFSFTSLLLIAATFYWLTVALRYLSKDRYDADAGTDQQQGQQKGNDIMSDMGHAHIRSYVDSSQSAPGNEAHARDLRITSLARSAAYRVAATVRESQPRIHTLVEELAACAGGAEPPQPPHNLDVDPVAALVFNKVVQERAAKGPDGSLGPRERSALETRLLEEVAEQCAAEQCAELSALAARGGLRGGRPGGGAGAAPPSPHAH